MANTAEDWAMNEIATVLNLFCDTGRAILRAARDPVLKKHCSAGLRENYNKLMTVKDDFLIAVGFREMVEEERKEEHLMAQTKYDDFVNCLDNSMTALLCYAKERSEAGDDDTAQGLMDVIQSLQVVGRFIQKEQTQ